MSDRFIPMSRAELSRAAAATRGRHLVPILEAVAADGIAFGVVPQREERVPLAPRPKWVVIVGDDPVDGAFGPIGFGDLKPLLRRATLIAVCSGAVVPAVYEGAAVIAASGGRVVIVETRVEQHAVWSELVRRAAPKARYLDVSPVAGSA
jgi:hypothetical protein